ncbi:MAG: transposase [Candidatus Saccharimonadales bacterium]
MPGRNIVKQYQPDGYYHLYNRGLNKDDVFRDAEDYRYFEWLLDRTVGPEQKNDKKGRPFTWLGDQIKLDAYCLMPNHYHILVNQSAEKGISQLMRTLGTAYTYYANKKYGRRGPLFENVYRAVLVEDDGQLMHLTRYIHLNPHDYKKWAYSSFSDYLGKPRPWVNVEVLMSYFNSPRQYRRFVNDYEEMQRERETLKRQLADNI